MLPLLVQPAQPEDDGNEYLNFIQSAMGPDEPSPFLSLLGTLQQGLQDVQNRPGPEMMDVPDRANPYASFLATVGANLAEQLGQQGAGSDMREQIEGVGKRRQDVQDYNRQLGEADRQQRMKDSLALQSQMIDVELEEAKRMGDTAKLRKELSARYAMDKEMQRLEDIDKDKERSNRLAVAHIYASSRQPSQQTQDSKVSAAILKLNNDLNNILSKPTSHKPVTTMPSMRDKFFKGAKPQTREVLTPESIDAARTHALSVARSDPNKEVKLAALSRYFETLRNQETGQIDPADIDRFGKLVEEILPTQEDQDYFLNTIQ